MLCGVTMVKCDFLTTFWLLPNVSVVYLCVFCGFSNNFGSYFWRKCIIFLDIKSWKCEWNYHLFMPPMTLVWNHLNLEFGITRQADRNIVGWRVRNFSQVVTKHDLHSSCGCTSHSNPLKHSFSEQIAFYSPFLSTSQKMAIDQFNM